MPEDEIGLVIATVASLDICDRDEIKHALATRMRNRTGHTPNHATLDRLLDRALDSSRIIRDQDQRYRVAT